MGKTVGKNRTHKGNLLLPQRVVKSFIVTDVTLSKLTESKLWNQNHVKFFSAHCSRYLKERNFIRRLPASLCREISVDH
jgi:hypothetical protein